jgi:hypothetical protein
MAEPIMLQTIKSSVSNSNFLYEFSSFVSMNLTLCLWFQFHVSKWILVRGGMIVHLRPTLSPCSWPLLHGVICYDIMTVKNGLNPKQTHLNQNQSTMLQHLIAVNKKIMCMDFCLQSGKLLNDSSKDHPERHSSHQQILP